MGAILATRDDNKKSGLKGFFGLIGFCINAHLGAPAIAQVVSGDVYQGQALAQKVCTVCHEVDKGRHDISPIGAPSFQDVADSPAATALSLRVLLQSWHEVMPNLILSPTETDDLIAYILSLK